MEEEKKGEKIERGGRGLKVKMEKYKKEKEREDNG